jgi:redox-sensitive bicupin YhaK (pirin superfamily)
MSHQPYADYMYPTSEDLRTTIRNFVGSRCCYLVLWALLISGCGRDLGTAQGVVEEFVDQHYVQINLEKAKQYAVGLALQKVDEEIRLTAGHKIDASTQKPRINYRLLEKKEGENRAAYLYEGTINSDDGHSFTRKWLIAARKEGSQWRVSNFTESD